MIKFRKFLAITVMMTTVLSLSVFAAPQAGAAAKAGDLIKMNGLSSVYYLAGDGKRYVFPNEATYFSWYGDFSGVVTIPQSELESYPLGANVTMRPGTKLVKITTNPKVYAVEFDGTLRPIPDEATAKALYGDMWAKRVVDVADAFFTNYTISSEAVSSSAYPKGTLVKMSTDSTVYYIGSDGKAQKVATEAAFLANRFKWSDVITAAAGYVLPTLGSDITAAVGTITDTSSGAGGTAGAGTGLTVAISSDTPEAGNIPAGSPVDFLTIKLTASNDGDVNVNGIRVKAYDLGTATYIDNVAFYDNGVKMGTSKNMTSDREAVFNFASPITVTKGTTKTLLVRATIESGKTGNFALGVEKAADVMTNGATVSGSFPIIGNSKAVVSGTTIGTVTMAGVSLDQSATAKFGDDNVLLASFTLRAANEDVIWNSARFRNAGTDDAGIVSNMRLEIDGEKVVEGATMADKYATFNLDNVVIKKNDTVTVEIYGDMGIGNVNDYVSLYAKEATDLVFTGKEFGFGIEPNVTALSAATQGIKVTLSAGDFTIDMDKTATPDKDVRAGTDKVILATMKMKSNSENATTDGIGSASADRFYVSGTGLMCNEFENAVLKDVDNGVSIDLSVASGTIANSCRLYSTEEISFAKGVTRTFQVIADLKGTSDDHNSTDGDKYQVTFGSNALTITGDVSDASITDITPSTVTSAVTTIKAARLTWTTTALSNKTVVAGASDVIVYEAGLKAGASSDVTLTSIKLDADDTYYDTFRDVNVSKLDLYLNGKLLKSVSNQIVNDGAAGGYITFNSLDTANRVIPAGSTYILQVKANFSSSFTLAGTNAFALELAAAASANVKDVDSNAFDITAANAGTDSRRITLASTGTLKVQLKTTSTKANKDTYILAGSETTKDRYIGELVFTTANEPVTVKKLALGDGSGNHTSSDVLVVRLYDSTGAVVAEQAPVSTGEVYFDALNKQFGADSETSLFIGVVTKTINAENDAQGTATYLNNIQFSLADSSEMTALGNTGGAAVEAEGADSRTTITMTQAVTTVLAANQYEKATTTSKTATVTGSVLTSITNALADGVLTNGNAKIIGKYTLVFDNGNNRTSGNIALKAQPVSLALTLATSSVSVLNVKAYNDADSSAKTAAAAVAGTKQTITGFSSTWADTGLLDGTVTIVIIGDVSGAASDDYVQTSIASLATGDLVYNGNGGTGSNISDPRLSITDVQGATLTN